MGKHCDYSLTQGECMGSYISTIAPGMHCQTSDKNHPDSVHYVYLAVESNFKIY